MNISLTLQWAIEHLRTSDSPNLDSEVLLSFVLKKPKEFLFAHPEQKLTNLKLRTYQLLIRRRAKGEPVAYLTGHKEFYGLDFKVSPAVLIPRPETELIVEEVKNLLTLKPFNHLTIIDVGTGSGCIPIAIATGLLRPAVRRGSQCRVFATDISPAALKIARQNAQRHGIKIKFLHGNLLEPIIKTLKHLNIKTLKQNNNLTIKPFNHLIIVANLPYLTTKQWRRTPPDVRLYEPRQALDGGPDGLKYFRELFSQIKKNNIQYLISNILLEIDPAQTKSIKRLIQKYFPSASLQIKKDLAGRDRMIELRITNSKL